MDPQIYQELIKTAAENQVKIETLEAACRDMKVSLHEINEKMDVIEKAVTQHTMVARIITWIITGIVTGVGVVLTWLGIKG